MKLVQAYLYQRTSEHCLGTGAAEKLFFPSYIIMYVTFCQFLFCYPTSLSAL